MQGRTGPEGSEGRSQASFLSSRVRRIGLVQALGTTLARAARIMLLAGTRSRRTTKYARPMRGGTWTAAVAVSLVAACSSGSPDAGSDSSAVSAARSSTRRHVDLATTSTTTTTAPPHSRSRSCSPATSTSRARWPLASPRIRRRRSVRSAAILSAADLAVGNLESAIATGGTPENKDFTFRAPPEAVDALRAGGFDAVSMANNHGRDYGAERPDRIARGQGRAGRSLHHRHRPRRRRRVHVVHATVKGQRVAVIGATQVIDGELVASWTAAPGHPGLASAKNVDALVAAVQQARAARTSSRCSCTGASSATPARATRRRRWPATRASRCGHRDRRARAPAARRRSVRQHVRRLRARQLRLRRRRLGRGEDRRRAGHDDRPPCRHAISSCRA